MTVTQSINQSVNILCIIGVSSEKGASETFGTDVISLFGVLRRYYSTEIRSEDIILFARK